MKSRRRQGFLNSIWWSNIWEQNRNAIIIFFCIIIPIIIFLALGFIKLKNWYLDCKETERIIKYYEELHNEEKKLKAEKNKAEYESWLNNPDNGYNWTKRQAEYKKERQESIKKASRNYYKIGDKIIVMSWDTIIPYQDTYIKDRIDVDVVRGFTKNGNVIGDIRIYSQDEIRKPFSKSEYSQLLDAKLSGKLNKE